MGVTTRCIAGLVKRPVSGKAQINLWALHGFEDLIDLPFETTPTQPSSRPAGLVEQAAQHSDRPATKNGGGWKEIRGRAAVGAVAGAHEIDEARPGRTKSTGRRLCAPDRAAEGGGGTSERALQFLRRRS